MEATEPRVPIGFKLKSSLRKIYDRNHDLVDRYGISVSQMTTDMFHCPHFPVLFYSGLVT
jgi:hypothetical protein